MFNPVTGEHSQPYIAPNSEHLMELYTPQRPPLVNYREHTRRQRPRLAAQQTKRHIVFNAKRERLAQLFDQEAYPHVLIHQIMDYVGK